MSAEIQNAEDRPMTEEEQDALGEAIIGTVVSLASAGFWFFSFAVHIYTAVIAFRISGIGASIISFLIPGFSELYWLIRSGSEIGYGSLYCLFVRTCG